MDAKRALQSSRKCLLVIDACWGAVVIMLSCLAERHEGLSLSVRASLRTKNMQDGSQTAVTARPVLGLANWVNTITSLKNLCHAHPKPAAVSHAPGGSSNDLTGVDGGAGRRKQRGCALFFFIRELPWILSCLFRHRGAGTLFFQIRIQTNPNNIDPKQQCKSVVCLQRTTLTFLHPSDGPLGIQHSKSRYYGDLGTYPQCSIGEQYIECPFCFFVFPRLARPFYPPAGSFLSKNLTASSFFSRGAFLSHNSGGSSHSVFLSRRSFNF